MDYPAWKSKMGLLAITGWMLLLLSCQVRKAGDITPTYTGYPQPTVQSLAYHWAEVVLEATANDTRRFNPRPTVTSRYIALIFISMFDAWSRYDDRAIPVYLGSVERIHDPENKLKNQEIAISYAAYHTLREYFYSDSTLFQSFMQGLGLDPYLRSTDPARPEGIGFLAAQAVIQARRDDGANQYGETSPEHPVPYFDYTQYQPVNTVDSSSDINKWQPKYFTDSAGTRFAPGCLTPHWYLVEPVALDSASQFRSPPPPAVGSAQLASEVAEVVELQANITPEQKAMVEFMRDGPASVQQAGHWLRFALDVSERDTNDLAQDLAMYLVVAVAAMDGFIACWDTKMFYDFARPFALVHHYYGDQEIEGWLGPDRGWGSMKGKDWRPYSPDNFLCPPFPAYVSGHSTVSGACSKTLELITGSDEFGEVVMWLPGSLTEPGLTMDSVALRMPTFTAAADLAGISRVLGGYHIQADNVEGLAMGRKVGEAVWQWYLKYHKG